MKFIQEGSMATHYEDEDQYGDIEYRINKACQDIQNILEVTVWLIGLHFTERLKKNQDPVSQLINKYI